MLVLTRKIDQGIVISGNIYVRVLGVERDRVKIGVSAPLDVTVLRQELLEREAAEGKGPRTKKDEGNGSPAPVTGRDEPKNDASG
jgi:carbon storage regulator